MDIALLRDVSPSIASCELTYLERQPIDPARAVEQHERYREVLRDLGLEIVSLPGDAAHPDCCFVEDTAVVLDEIAVITRPGAASRRDETRVVAEALAAYRHVVAIEAPGTLDGGDVLVMGRKILVGRSRRTNGAGIEALRAIVSPHGYEVVPVAVTGCLHLKSAATAIDEESVIANKDWVDLQPFRGFEVVPVPPEEPWAANVLIIRGRVLVSAGSPLTHALLEKRGSVVIPVQPIRVPEGGGRHHLQEPPLPPSVCLPRRVLIGSSDCRAIEGPPVRPPRKDRMLRKTVVLAVALAAVAGGCKGKEEPPAGAEKGSAGEFKSEDDKVIYAFGAMLGTRFAEPLQLTPGEIEMLKKGITDTASGGKPAFPVEEYGPKLDALVKARAAARAGGEKAKAQAFRDQAAQEQGAVKTPSGLVYKSLKAGSGKSPSATDTVSVHYHGTLTDGKVFDSSVERGQPAEFPLNGVIPCWTEGVQRMKVGEKAKLVCPSDIAYGDSGRPPTIPPGATLVFEVELLGDQAGK